MKHSSIVNPDILESGLEMRLDAIATLTPELGIILIDPQDTIIYASPRIASWLECARSNLVGRSYQSVVSAGDVASASPTEVRLALPDGRRVVLEQRSVPMLAPHGDVQGTAVGWIEKAGGANTAPSDLDAVTEHFHRLLSRDPHMRQAFAVIRNAAQTDATVLIRGESGTGKELAAEALHAESHRGNRAFLALNCATLTPSLLESELFGHVRGAFTGATKDHAGMFQRADGGTLFLDEVAELPLELQAKLLRVLQERSFLPVGGDRAISVDVRIVAATHRSLRAEVRAGNFREDLLYRLRVVPIFLPPLRERRCDIALLLWHFIERYNARGPRRIGRISPEAMRLLLDYSWPGNVRELQNVAEYAFAVGRGTELSLDDLPPEFREPALETAYATRPARRDHPDDEQQLRWALAQSHGRMEVAATLLGMSRATFWRKRKKWQV